MKKLFFLFAVLCLAGCLDQQAPGVDAGGMSQIPAVDRSREEGIQPPPEPELFRAGGG